MNIVKENYNSEIVFPTLAKYKEKYSKILSNYKREYEDNNEKVFIELQIEHWRTYSKEFLEKEGHTFNKYQVEKLRNSRSLIVEFLEEKLNSLTNHSSTNSNTRNIIVKEIFDLTFELAKGNLDEYFLITNQKTTQIKNGLKASEIAQKIGKTSHEKHVLATLNYYNNNNNNNKNLWVNKKYLKAVYDYCKENNHRMTDFFIEKHNQIIQD